MPDLEPGTEPGSSGFDDPVGRLGKVTDFVISMTD
jgi:hypothetical protein